MFDTTFRYRAAAQWLNIPHTEIADTPIPILESAWQDWEAQRDAEFRLRAKFGS